MATSWKTWGPWEYLVIYLNPNSDVSYQENTLDNCGRDDWELVSVQNDRVYFKRPKKEN